MRRTQTPRRGRRSARGGGSSRGRRRATRRRTRPFPVQALRHRGQVTGPRRREARALPGAGRGERSQIQGARAIALEPVIGAVAKRMEARAANLEAAAAAGDSKEAKAMARKSEGKQKGEPNLDDPGAEPLLLRLCGTLRARLLGAAERGGAPHDCAWACEKVLAAELKTYGGAAAGSESSPRVAMAACAGLFALDAPSGADGAKARAAAWQAIVRGGGGRGRAEAAREFGYQDEGVLLDPSAGPVARSAACRAVAALGEARAAARAVSGGDRAGQDGSLASLVAALKANAGPNSPPGVRVEALRALVWLQTPDFANAEATSELTTHLDDGERAGGDDRFSGGDDRYGEVESFVGSANGSARKNPSAALTLATVCSKPSRGAAPWVAPARMKTSRTRG